MAFNVYEWRRNQLLIENSTSNDAGGTELIKSKQYSKEDIIKAVGMYGKIKLGSGEAIPVSNLDNEGKYTYTMDSYSVSAQKAVPVFIPAGKPKSIGSSDTTIGFQIKADKAKGKKPMRGLDENESKPINEDLNFDAVDGLLNDILEQYLDGIGENTDENGNIDFGGGVGYKNKKELLSDFITFIQNFE
jgi:hypothetical protein